jgi:hypothetical protein
MGSRRPPSAPQWQVILEEMRSENRATLEAVLTLQTTFEARMDRTDEELKALGRQHGRALADHSRTIAGHNKTMAEHSSTLATHTRTIADQSKAIAEMGIGLRENTIELRSLSQRVDAVIRIEDRVAALEKRAFGPGGGSTPAPA